MATEHFCLRWNNHQSTLVSVFDNLLESGTLVDCTLAADGRYLKAHKVVLSACSPYLGMLLSQHYDKHPIIILKDVKFDELKAMLDYMYRGEVNISQEQLSTFLKAAETLQIKGLTDAGSDEGNGLQPNRPPSSNSTTSANEDPQSPGPPEGGSSPGPRKRKRNKHGEDGEVDSVSKISLSESSDRLSGTSVGSPSAKSGSVKREPGDGDGDGQMSVDESGEVVMMSRPGPSNGGTNNKAPWILSADSSGEEMQLTPGQDDQRRRPGGHDHEIKNKVEYSGEDQTLEEQIKKEIEEELDPLQTETRSWEEENSVHQNPNFVYALTRSETEVIIPDSLEDPTLLNRDLTQDYFHPVNSILTNFQREIPERSGDGHRGWKYNSSNNVTCGIVQKESSHIKNTTTGTSTGNRSKRYRPIVSKPMPSSLQKSNHTSVTEIDLSDNPQTQLARFSQTSSSPSPENRSKIVVGITNALDKNIVKAKKTKFSVVTKFRKILPASEDNLHCINKPSLGAANVQLNQTSNIETQSNDSSPPQFSSSPLNSSGKNIESTCVQMNNTNHQISSGDVVNNSSGTPSLIPIPQQIHVGQITSPNSSLLSMPHQPGQVINSSSNILPVSHHVPASQMSSQSTAILSITPQFSMTPIPTNNIQMQFSNNSNLQTGNFPNTPFFSNANGSQNQVVNYQNGVITQQAQGMAQPVFVTSNIISQNQPNQFIPATPVNYNVSAEQSTIQPNFCIQTSQPQNSTSHFNNSTSQPCFPSSSVSTVSTSSTAPPPEKDHTLYLKFPRGVFHQVRRVSESNRVTNNPSIGRGRGPFFSGLRTRGRPPLRKRGGCNVPLMSILPKK